MLFHTEKTFASHWTSDVSQNFYKHHNYKEMSVCDLCTSAGGYLSISTLLQCSFCKRSSVLFIRGCLIGQRVCVKNRYFYDAHHHFYLVSVMACTPLSCKVTIFVRKACKTFKQEKYFELFPLFILSLEFYGLIFFCFCLTKATFN